MIMERVEGLAEKMIRSAGESRILSVISREVRGEAFGRERIRFSGTPGLTAGGMFAETWQRRFRRKVLQWQKESVILRSVRRVFAWILRGSMGSFGVFLLVSGVVSLCVYWLSGETSVMPSRFLIPLFTVIASFLLLHSGESLSSGIRNGAILHAILIGFCGLGDVLPDEGAKDRAGEERRYFSLVSGILCGLLTLWVHPARLLLFALIPIGFVLLCEVPELALFCTFTVFPFLGYLPHPSAVLAGLLVVCDVVWLGKLVSGKRQSAFGTTDLAVLFFCLLLAAGGAVTAAGSGIAGFLSSFLLFSAWFPIRGLLQEGEWRRRCLAGLMVSSLFCSVSGIFQYCSGKGEMKWIDISRFSDIGGRVSGPFGNPNIFAVFLLLTTPLFLIPTVMPRKRIQRVAGIAGLAAGTLCLVFTWSRGAWLGWIFGMILFLLFYNRKSLSVLILLPLPVLAVLPQLPHSVVNRFRSIGSFSETSVRYRLFTWRGVIRTIRAHPFGIGVGESVFRAVYPDYAVSGTESVMHAHQIFLQIALESGVPGLLFFLFLIFRFFRHVAAFCARERHPRRRAVLLSTVVALCGALTMGIFDHIWYHSGLFWLFWCIGALLLNGAQSREEGIG